MKNIKTPVSVALILGMLLSVMGSMPAMADDGSWEDFKKDNLQYHKFLPEDQYVSLQNPPTFRWPYVDDSATYEVIVCADSGLSDVKYRQSGITTNFYQFSTTFEVGVPYYWAVRYTKSGSAGNWSQARRFRIDPDASACAVEDIDVILSRVPASHPRIFTRPEKVADLRNLKNTSETSRRALESLKSRVDGYLAAGEIPAEPQDKESFANAAEKAVFDQALRTDCARAYDTYWYCGLYYMLTGDEQAGRMGIKALTEVSKWDINGVSSYKRQDQIHREIAYKGAMAYDWLYPLMTTEERAMTLKMVRDRTKVMEYLLDSLKASPFDSHGWTAFGFIGIIAVATYGEIPEAAGWLKTIIPAYSAMLPPWSYQDGGWSQGTDYWQYSTYTNKEFMNVLYLAGIADLYSNAWQQNEFYWSMYAYPAGSRGSFGDQSNRNTAESHPYSAKTLLSQAAVTRNPQTKWLYDSMNPSVYDDYMTYMLGAEIDSLQAEQPLNQPLAHEFSDIGWAVMTDSLVDKQRIMCTFKSSPYGSFNHSHADQNSFLIEAFGENLAIKGGYYDGYHTEHDSGFTRTTPAHNSVTVATGKGQKDDAMHYNGKMTNFINHVDFDVVSGDASAAYDKNVLSKFARTMIYIRPDVFVVIDDLAAPPKTSKQFEWWLNAEHDIQVYEDANGARLQEGAAVLDAAVQYPEKVKTYYNNMFASSNMKEYPAQGNYANSNVHRRVWFETEKVEKTKMIVTMDVHRSGTDARYVDTENTKTYTKMTFADGTVCIVNLGDKTETVTAEGITFTGEAVVYNDESIMLVSGTSLSWAGVPLITAASPMSLCMGKNEVGLSTYEDNDVSIHVNNDYISGVSRVTDYNGREIGAALGITYEAGAISRTGTQEGEAAYTVAANDDMITFHAQKDNYALMLNGKRFQSELVSGKVTVSIDGEAVEYPTQGSTRRDGSVNYLTTVEMPGRKFRIKDKSAALNFGGGKIGDSRAFGTVNISSAQADNFIELETVETVKLTSDILDDYDAVKDSAAIVVEAEDYAGKIADGAAVYTTRSFLSGGAGVQLFNTPGTQMTYTFDVAEAGQYDFAVKYVSWVSTESDTGTSVRSFTLNGKDYEFSLERKTDGFGGEPEQWKAAVTDSGIMLEPGTYTITFDAISGNWNYDWFALIKR